MTHRLAIAALVAALLLGACDPIPGATPVPPPATAPAPAADMPSVAVFGDSLTPAPDYQTQAGISGYDLGSWAQGGSHMCTTFGGRPLWERILRAAGQYDAVVLQFQGWQNLSDRFDCGARASDHPFDPRDPSKRWRVHLDDFRLAAQATGAHIFVVQAAGAPPDRPEWTVPQARMDAGARTMATRHPETITFVETRPVLAAPGGAYAARLPCTTADRAHLLCEGDGWVTLRHPDGVHYLCPGRPSSLVCPWTTSAGLRQRTVLAAALDQRLRA